MIKHALLKGMIVAAFWLPAQAVLAESPDLATGVKATMRPAIQQMHSMTSAAVLAKSKTYTDSKNGFSVTLPSTWKKMKASSGAIFNAQPLANNNAVWMLSITKYTKQKQADNANNKLRNKPAEYGQIVLEELQKQFPDAVCTLKTSGKKTLGANSGARANVVCTQDNLPIVFSLFSFVKKLSFYSATYVIYESEFSTLLSQFDAVTKSLIITK